MPSDFVPAIVIGSGFGGAVAALRLGQAGIDTLVLVGRVKHHPGLYVVDGALIEGSAGLANPSRTIAALAERCLAQILVGDHLTNRDDS